MHIVVLAGGIGGARFLTGVRAYAREVDAEVTAVVNVGDDVRLHGLRICPDLDSVMYTLGGGADPRRGWGRVGETWTIREELAAYGAEPTWFGLGDRDTATHLVRTSMLDAGYPLSAVTEALCARWQPGVRLLPATDDRLETHVVVGPDPTGPDGPPTGPDGPLTGPDGLPTGPDGPPTGPDGPPTEAGGRRAIHFQEWWVRYRGNLPTHRFVFVGADAAKPAPGVLAALDAADVVLLAPSNPVVSIAPVLAVPGLREAVAGGRAPVVGISPVIGGAPVRGMADRCLAVLDVPCTAEGVGGLYGARSAGGVLDGWLVDEVDSGARVPGVTVAAAPLWMTDETTTVAMVRAALDLARRAGTADGADRGGQDEA